MTNKEGYSVYNPVDVQVKPNEVIGALFLGVLSVILLISFLRSQRQIRELQASLLAQKIGQGRAQDDDGLDDDGLDDDGLDGG